ncbi:glycosyl hydrolase family 18 protein [Effusibacillus dendaii]|uniref:Putative sporulation-specific glycosylase YdhD n=1 Tax=Effusibacillus dendaii TaxID=2743772 RepID=A0A7I8DH06_9BACL|nr:glycosyl hydrolase family 18 protein [Effusibacillus dendaii]BCJ88289.1 putative sporulation-specific glycosylase YdhD [Effusibacillus dendaii]
MKPIYQKILLLILSIICFSSDGLPVYANRAPDSFVIYEVKTGDTLTKIANVYHQSVAAIKTTNGLSGERIVPGQSLILSGNEYILAAGDSIWKIAERHGISQEEIIRVNNVQNPLNTWTGTKIVVPQPQKTSIMTGAYMVPKNKLSDLWLLRQYSPLVTQIGIFEYHPDHNGTLSPLYATTAIKESWKQHSEPVAVVTNLTQKGFDPELAHRLLKTPKLRRKLIQNIDILLRTQGYKGVNIDFEQLYPQDREFFNQFMNELAQKLKRNHFTLSIAVPAKQGDQTPSYLAGYDYAALGKVVDYFFLMTYDWHWLGGPAGPIAPIRQVRATLNYAVTRVPKQKLFLGIPMYAYDWTLSPNGKTSGKSYAQSQAIELAMDHGSPIQYDKESESPYFYYTDASGGKHVVWFEDARSIVKKYRLITKYNIKGMGGWKLGLSFPQAESIASRMFQIVKP